MITYYDEEEGRWYAGQGAIAAYGKTREAAYKLMLKMFVIDAGGWWND